MKTLYLILVIFILALNAPSQQWLNGDLDDTTVTLTTTNMTGMTQLLPAAKDGVIVANVCACNNSNSTAIAMIVYGTNSVAGGGLQVAPGNCVCISSPPHPNAAIFGYLQNAGTANLAMTRQPAGNKP